MNSGHYYMGIDGGGTRVRAVLVDAAGRELGRGEAGTANLATVGVAGALASISAAVEIAVTHAGVALPLTLASCGLAGVDRPADLDALGPHLRFIAAEVHLSNDAELGLEALPGGCGVCVISGTGSIALGRDSSGHKARAGGWGHVMGDEGSGYDIGRRALIAIARAADGRGPQTTLSGPVLQAWGLSKAEDLIGYVYPDPPPSLLAELSALVFNAAAAGDAVAQEIVAIEADDLAIQVLAVADKLSFPDSLPLALTGGVLRHQATLRDAVIAHVSQRRPVGPLVIVHDAALAAAQGIAARAAL